MGALGLAGSAQQPAVRAGSRRSGGPGASERPAQRWQSLTPMEQRVARLIAAGHTNRSAATEVALSPNTIATHLQSTFRKMVVNSRVR